MFWEFSKGSRMLSLPKVIEISKTIEFSIEFYLVFEYNLVLSLSVPFFTVYKFEIIPFRLHLLVFEVPFTKFSEFRTICIEWHYIRSFQQVSKSSRSPSSDPKSRRVLPSSFSNLKSMVWVSYSPIILQNCLFRKFEVVSRCCVVLIESNKP